MITVTCPCCGRRVTWNDFQAEDFCCPDCETPLNLRSSLRQNLDTRQQDEIGDEICCPRCGERIPRRWLVRCPGCRYYVWGSRTMHRRWPVIMLMLLGYLTLTYYYVINVLL